MYHSISLFTEPIRQYIFFKVRTYTDLLIPNITQQTVVLKFTKHENQEKF